MRHSIALTGAALACMIGGAGAHASASWQKPGHKMPPIFHASSVTARSRNADIVGTWLASYDGGVHNAFAQWGKGGTTSQIVDFGAKTGNVLLGDWSTDGQGTYTAALKGWTFDTKGNKLTGTFVKTESEDLSGDTYSGTFEVTFYDLQGNIVFQHDGSVSATRIESQ